MPQKFKSIKVNQFFYDFQSRSFYVKRSKTTAAMLYRGKDVGLDGDDFDLEDNVMCLDGENHPLRPLDQKIKVSSGCLHFSGTVADAEEYLLAPHPENDNNLAQQLNLALKEFISNEAIASLSQAAESEIST